MGDWPSFRQDLVHSFGTSVPRHQPKMRKLRTRQRLFKNTNDLRSRHHTVLSNIYVLQFTPRPLAPHCHLTEGGRDCVLVQISPHRSLGTLASSSCQAPFPTTRHPLPIRRCFQFRVCSSCLYGTPFVLAAGTRIRVFEHCLQASLTLLHVGPPLPVLIFDLTFGTSIHACTLVTKVQPKPEPEPDPELLPSIPLTSPSAYTRAESCTNGIPESISITLTAVSLPPLTSVTSCTKRASPSTNVVPEFELKLTCLPSLPPTTSLAAPSCNDDVAD